MKKFCIFSDVHGNSDVLKILAETDDFKNADERIFLGDAVGCCPNFNEVLKILFENNCIVLLGNHDVRAIFNRYDKKKFGNADQEPHFKYIREHMLPEYLEKFKNSPKEYILKVNGKILFFTHYICRTKYFIAERVKPMTLGTVSKKFESIKADYIFYGHEHKESYFCNGTTTYVGVGSLGMKFPGNYVMLEVEDDGEIVITCKKLKYDLTKLRREIRLCELPLAKQITDEFYF